MEKENKYNEECLPALEKLTDLLQSGTGASAVQNLIEEYPDCESIILGQVATWERLKFFEVPEPSAAMDAAFYRELNKMDISTTGLEAPRFGKTKQMLARLTVAASIFIGGLLIGKYYMVPTNPEHLAVLDQEMAPQDYLNYAATEQKKFSATDKLSALQEIKSVDNPDQKVLNALYQALLNDPNINVRLSAVETLVFFAEEPSVREFLIKAIPHQTSPLVQIALAEATTVLQEKEAANAWQQLLSSDEVEPDIRMHLRKTLEPIL